MSEPEIHTTESTRQQYLHSDETLWELIKERVKSIVLADPSQEEHSKNQQFWIPIRFGFNTGIECIQKIEKGPVTPLGSPAAETNVMLTMVAIAQFKRAQKAEKELERAKGILATIDAECTTGSRSIDYVTTLAKPYAQNSHQKTA